MSDELSMEGCLRLCEAVLEQAGRDYRTWYRALLESPGNKTAQQEVDALERFIHSPQFKLFGMGELDPEATIRELRKLAEATCRRPYDPTKKGKKGNNRMSIINRPAVQCDICGTVKFAEWGGNGVGWLLPSGWRNSPYNENLCSCEQHRELVALWDKTQETPPQRGWHS